MTGWKQSEQWRQIARAAIQAYNASRPSLPKCGALARHSGEPCKNVAMANGRCRFHGGRTPSGDAWHKPRWPDRKYARPERRLARKLKRLERAREEKERRLAAMSPAEREAYSFWHATHLPGPSANRARAGEQRTRAREGVALLKSLPAEPFEGAADLEALIQRLEAQLAAMQPETKSPTSGFDVFS